MVNVKTLSPLYPTTFGGLELSANQMVSMHLLLHRPIGEEDSLDSRYGPYISTMPRDFDSHPITWVVRSQLHAEDNLWPTLCKFLPSSVKKALQDATARFWDDCDSVCLYLVRILVLFLNTLHCIYSPESQSKHRDPFHSTRQVDHRAWPRQSYIG